MTTAKPSLGIVPALGWTAAVFVTLHLVMGWLISVSPRARFDIVSLGAVEVLVLGGAAALLAGKAHSPKAHQPWALELCGLFGLGAGRWFWLCLGVLLGAALKFPAGALRAVVELRWPTPSEDLAAQALLLRHDTPGQVLALVLVVGLLGPIVEEVFYRGVLFQTLKNAHGALVASVFVTVAFTLAHASLRDWGPLLLVSAAFTFVRVRSETLWPCLAAHIAFNSATLFALVYGLESAQPIGMAPEVLVIASIFVVALLTLAKLARPSSKDVHE